MFSAQPPNEKEILKSVLIPLLDDFLYWFDRSLSALEKEQLSFMDHSAQQDLINRIRQAQGEVNTAKLLFKVTDGNAGIDPKAMLPWHNLVAECWAVAKQRRLQQDS